MKNTDIEQSSIEGIMGKLSGDFKKMAELVGIENALKISKVFGGFVVAIPKLGFILREERNKEIRNAYDQGGESVRTLAGKHNLTMRQIQNILSEKERIRE
jgi:Mor family transcriptional regulator